MKTAARTPTEMREAIRDRIRHDPFEPFRIVTRSGESYDVPSSAFCSLSGGYVGFGIDYSAGDGFPNDRMLLPLEDVADVPVTPAAGVGQAV